MVSCAGCGARITVAGVREAGEDRVTRQAVDCPLCRSRVPLAIRGAREHGQTRLIRYERRPGSRPHRGR